MRLLLPLFCAAAALAQTPEQIRTFTVAHPLANPQQWQEVINTVRAIGEARDVKADFDQQTLSVGGVPAQHELVSWLLTELDHPAEAGALTVREYSFPAPREQTAVRIFRPAHIRTPLALQETINAIRSLIEVQRVTVITAVPAIVIRGTPDQAPAAEWIVRQLDTPSANAEYRMTTPDNAIVRTFFLAPNTPKQTMADQVNRIRTEAQIQRVAAYTAANAILLRGTPDQVAAAEQILR
jgi:type II secretory pathway component GspD/PulD (secretin)